VDDDTAGRSLAHWSEAGRAEMDAFYAIARLDYRLLAEAADWGALLRAHAGPDGRVRLLDVACGSGKFPEALLRYAALPADLRVEVDLLDPSAFSLAEAARALAPPLHEGRRHECTLQALDAAAGPYDVVWATHALYALPAAELADGVGAFTRALAPGGLGFVAHASSEAHYLRFYEAFLADFRDGQGTPYTSSEQVAEAFAASGAQVERRRIAYAGELALDDRATVEGYLQRCAFDDGVPLAAMEAAPTLGPYLAARRDEAAGRWRFPQQVDLLTIRTD
jgi:SAM-dependent methyltransferase